MAEITEIHYQKPPGWVGHIDVAAKYLIEQDIDRSGIIDTHTLNNIDEILASYGWLIVCATKTTIIARNETQNLAVMDVSGSHQVAEGIVWEG